MGKLEAEGHLAYGDAVSIAEGLEGVGREALVVDYGAIHRAQVLDVELVARAGEAEVATRYAKIEAAVWPQVNVGIAVALRVAAAHDYLHATRHGDGGGRRGRCHYQLCC